MIFSSEWEMTCLGSHREENLELWLEVITGQSNKVRRGDCECVWALGKFFTEINEMSFEYGNLQTDPFCQVDQCREEGAE